MIATGAYVPLSNEERLKIEAGIEHHRIEAARLIRRLNASTLVMCLPDELLVEIFTLCIPLRHDNIYGPSWNHAPHYGWLRLTHVCHHWREVALHMSALWTNIEVTNPEFVTSFLERSENAVPLHVHFFGTDMHGEELQAGCWMPILRASSRVHSLLIKLGDSLLTFPPIYESGRELLLTGMRELNLDYTVTSQPTLPCFISPHLPHLHTLRSHMLPYQVIKPLLAPSLKSLLLDQLRMPDSTMLRPFFEALGQLTRLERLVFIDSFFPLPADWRQLPLFADTGAVLPSLRHLHLVSHTFDVDVALVLRNLCFPGDVSVQISQTGISPFCAFQEDEAHYLFSALESRLSGSSSGALASPSPVLTLALRSNHGPGGTNTFNLNGWSSVIPLDPAIYENDPDGTMFATLPSLSFSIRWFSTSMPADPASMKKLSLVSALQQVQAFAIDTYGDHWHGPDPVSPESLQAGLASLCKVETAFARGCGVRPLLTALRVPWGPHKQFLFPSLKTLHIFGYQFVHLWSFGDDFTNEEDSMNEEDFEIDLVKHTLVERAQGGLRLDKLVISRCKGMGREELNELSELVRELIWDDVGVADPPEVLQRPRRADSDSDSD
ncbi:uncharacterized protein PHACADRAFT_256839 [Phanerochaete carnosa HHB-10118-sp]|uniref:F-box domain-containing protein n=1 Tax=Phanerochaete carnosa (strain HHB-10118-sp) TaxID=650164 RepID=K5WZI4_PHACS|nr:uncharacterized protein PHACADRAFT_256839 [Phanerochaete carnosa HHB-10118-sp]EKM55907.1 hypothetical protein PHACADRAFT_256839 [Phanerochaete carnosa HHB-10118-sp]